MSPPKSHSSSSSRKATIKQFREVRTRSHLFTPIPSIPPLSFSSSPSWKDLKEIHMKDVDPTEQKMLRGYFLELTIIDDPNLSEPVEFVVEDKNKDVSILIMTGFPDPVKAVSKIWEEYRFGTVIRVANPMVVTNSLVKMAFPDGHFYFTPDPQGVSVVGRKRDMCRYCGKEGAPKRCVECKRLYCDRKCQKKDWKLNHKIICELPSS